MNEVSIIINGVRYDAVIGNKMHFCDVMQDYIDKTRKVVNFLRHVYDQDVDMIAHIVTAQLEKNTKAITEMLERVIENISEWKEELKRLDKIE